MLTTLEMRWFKEGTIPSKIRQWFAHDCPGKLLEEQQIRTDWYFKPIAPCDYLNLKLREGRLEIKWREAQLAQIDCGWQGTVEQWVKWLCQQDSIQEIGKEQGSQQDTPWVAVEKTRSQRQFVLSLDTCCNLELTQLRVRNQYWWSMGFESTGNLESLHAIAREVSETYPEPLTEEEAFAYPHWLSYKLR